MFSYWEQQSFSYYDHIIVGAGLVGINLALEIRKLFPADLILVTERALLPTGASTRNAGFACMGSATELLADLQHSSTEEVVQLFQWRMKGIELLRKNLGDANIGYSKNGGYELLFEDHLYALDKLDYLNELLMPVTAQKAFVPSNHQLKNFGFSDKVKGLIENTLEGGLDSGMLMRTLIKKATQGNIEIKTGAEAISYYEKNDQVSLMIKDPFRKENWALKCKTLSICTNAFARQLLPNVDVTPGRGQVLVTHPIEGLKLKGIYHFDEGYYYFREINGRVLFGGGRNLDIPGETTTEIALNELIQGHLEEKLREVILPRVPFTIDQCWAGIMAFGKDKQPIVRSFSPRVFGAFRMGGMGVALSSHVAHTLADIIYNSFNNV
ncbi:MAG: FAD-binding oxidoreductase [Taibaiella sp.]|nr:FAD-binding oxidoreductase [Taibaiella sp.]